MRRILCWLFGHDWRVDHMDADRSHLQAVCWLAGCYATCRRCERVWDDLTPRHRSPLCECEGHAHRSISSNRVEACYFRGCRCPAGVALPGKEAAS